MTSKPRRILPAGLAALLILGLTNPHVTGQTAAPANGNAQQDVPVQLSVFEVAADPDDSYGALNSNSITRFNIELAKLPISADIYNEAFMRDINAVSVEQMIAQYTAGAGFASNNAAASTEDSAPGDRTANASVKLRGLTAPAMLRDAFMTLQTYSNTGSTATGVTNSFDLERTEVIMGPQSLLYGSGGGGGVINLVTKQARFGRRLGGDLRLRTDSFGSKIATLDVGWGGSTFAFRAAFIHQHEKTRRINIGNDLDGQYVQLAWKPFANTVVRLSATQTWNFRTYATNLSANTVNANFDARHGQRLRYLLATGQIERAASGPSNAGPIAGGNIHWGNVDSWFGNARAERTLDTISQLTVETKWGPRTTSQFAIGYKDYHNQLFTQSTSALLAPNHAANPTGTWGIGATGTGMQRNIQPGRAFPVRFSVAFENELFNRRARAQSIVGVDYLRMRNAFINYNYFLADEQWNVVVNPRVAANNGRTNMPPVIWPMTTLSANPIPGWSPGQERFVMGGQNYVLMQSNPANVNPRTPDNPHGVTPGGSNYNIDNARNKGLFAVTDVSWLEGRLHTLAGFRLSHAYVKRESQGTRITVFNSESGAVKVNDDKFFSYNIGANYALREWLRPYFSFSDAYIQPAGANNDPLGNTLQAAHSVGGEIGVKVQNASGTVSGSLALYHVNAKNEAMTVTSTASFYINPSGLNGRFGGAPSVWMNIDREARGAQITLTANPTRNWRMRLSAATVSGETKNDKSYRQVYNDQFHTNAQGQVTYSNGQLVYVRPTFSSSRLTVEPGTPGAMPLTVQMLSTPGNPYYANPSPVSGAIGRSSNGGRVLQFVHPEHGPIVTGATGLPITEIQINPGFTPPGEIPVTRAGEGTTNYPTLSAVFTTMYTFDQGVLRGLRIGGTAMASWKNRRYYYYPRGVGAADDRELFSYPTLSRFDLILGYTWRVRSRYSISTQLNVQNIADHYKIIVLPNAITGWSGVKNAVFAGEPRSWTLSTTLGF